jgi:hypothetical protein
MTQHSRFDELHDRYHAILTTKTGTRYERLAALVFKILEDRNVVIHNVKLIGDSAVAHQIDISIEVNGARRRVIIECKDFDLSGKKVGLEVVRNFRSVIEDTNADEGIVLTCTGYTKDALQYAKAKNIKLAVLREIRGGDLEGLIQAVHVDIHIQRDVNHAATIAMNQTNRDLFASELAAIGIQRGIHKVHPVYFVKGDERVQYTDFLSKELNQRKAIKNAEGRWEVVTPPEGWSLQVADGPLVQFDYMKTSFDEHTLTVPIRVTSDRIAELLLTGLGDDDIIIFGDQLERRKIDPESGEIL